MVGRSFRNANQQTLVGRSISLGLPSRLSQSLELVPAGSTEPEPLGSRTLARNRKAQVPS